MPSALELEELQRKYAAARRAEKVVWLLGAGFSKPLGGPLFREFFDDYTAGWVDAWLTDSGLTPGVFAAGKQVYKNGCDMRLWDNPEQGLEDLNEAISDNQGRIRLLPALGGNPLEAACTQLSQYLAVATSFFVNRIEKSKALPDRWAYKEWWTTLTPNDFVLSLNYDRVVEELNRRWPHQTGDLVKLHGTVPDFSTLREYVKNQAPVKEIMVPGPAKLDAIANPHWGVAAMHLMEAHRLIIVGYSFPPSDSAARHFFFKNSQAKDVTIVLGRSKDGSADRLAESFERLGAKAMNTGLYAQEFLAEGSAKREFDRFRHFEPKKP